MQRSRPPYRPPIGVPVERPDRWGLPVSVAVHAMILLLLIGGILTVGKVEIARGAGGAGPMGGGGGGRLGLAGSRSRERVKYVQLAQPKLAAPRVTHPITPPVTKPPKPVEAKPVVKPQVMPAEQIAPASSAAPTVIAVAPSAGAGTDGTNGAGPGTGGGTGAGTGPGRGSGSGPGTGGGEGTVYPATPDFAVIPPLPVPKGLHGKTVQLRFTIDETGRVVKFDFDPTGDSGYDRELKSRLSEYHFRPAHKQDGTPVASIFVTQFTL
ncbi:MAG TPA: hypothetical protein VJO52_13605 [Gemmatimonadaceae bacterium]|nr:hypothetical protein [Gemmatimonadaceae bacterium]